MFVRSATIHEGALHATKHFVWPYSLSFRYFFLLHAMCMWAKFLRIVCVFGGGRLSTCVCVWPLSSNLTSKRGTSRTKEIERVREIRNTKHWWNWIWMKRPRRRRWLRGQQFNKWSLKVFELFPFGFFHSLSLSSAQCARACVYWSLCVIRTVLSLSALL